MADNTNIHNNPYMLGIAARWVDMALDVYNGAQ